MGTWPTAQLIWLAVGVAAGALLIGTMFAGLGPTRWWRRWSGRDRHSVLDRETAEAVEAASDLQHGSRNAARSSRHDDASDDGGGDGGGD